MVPDPLQAPDAAQVHHDAPPGALGARCRCSCALEWGRHCGWLRWRGCGRVRLRYGSWLRWGSGLRGWRSGLRDWRGLDVGVQRENVPPVARGRG